MNLHGRKIAITGASGCLGEALARMALAQGATVAAISRRECGAFGAPNLHWFTDADTASAEAMRGVFAAIGERLGGLDALVNAAGAFGWETFAGGSLAIWDRLYEANLRSAVAACQAALPLLGESGAGRIVNVGAAGALKAGIGMGAYAAAKAGVAKLTEALAEELKPRGITVNAVLPSIIDTPANRRDMPEADFSCWVRPEQIADAIGFLLSDRAQAITGALIPVTGRV